MFLGAGVWNCYLGLALEGWLDWVWGVTLWGGWVVVEEAMCVVICGTGLEGGWWLW